MVNKHCFDAHIHVESEQMTPYTALELIKKQGLKAALVDHVFSDRDRITPDSIKNDCRKKFNDVDFIHGCEVDIYGEGVIALPENLITSMDFIIVSFTHIGQPGAIDSKYLIDNLEQSTAILINLLEIAVCWPHTDVIAHPFALPLDTSKAEGLAKLIGNERLNKALLQAAERKVLIEINARTLRRMALEPQKIFLQEALNCGCLFTIGSDAHCLKEIGQTKEAWDMVDELKIPDENIVFPFFQQKYDKN